MQTQRLNPKQRLFLKLYTGKDPAMYGNASKCYRVVYDCNDPRSAQVGGSRLITNPKIAKLLEAAQARAVKEINVNAEYVLSQSVRLLNRAMGDESVEHISTTVDDNGQESIKVRSRTEYDPSTAKAALRMIGDHRDIQAFTQTIEHTHTHRLEQRLAQRAKVIEGKASVLADQVAATTQALAVTQDLDSCPGSQVDEAHPAAGPGDGTHRVKEERKRLLSAEVKSKEDQADERSSFERGRATAN